MRVFAFNPHLSVILCHAWLRSGGKEIALKMAVDTGATFTMIPREAVQAMGCYPRAIRRSIDITTGSGIVRVPLITIPAFESLGVSFADFEVVCHTLPAPSPIEGLLGLNFLTRAKAVINFATNTLRV